MNKRILSALLALTLVFALAGMTPALAADKPITFKLAMVDNEQSNYYKGAQAIAASVEEATEGKIKIDVVAGGTLGGEADTLDMAIQGDLAIASAANSVLANYIPEMAILDQAFLWDSQDQANYAVQNELGALISEKAEALGIHVIGYMESGFRDVFSKKPIQSIDDFKGVKIRTMQNKGQLAAFTSFGANPVALAAGEQFTALQQGTIDACENAVSNCWVNKFYEAGVNSVTTTHHSFVYIPLCMSDNAWNQIPDDLKETFVEAVWAGCEQQWQFLNEANEEAIELLKGVGVSFYDIDIDSLKEAYAAKVEADGTTYDEAWVAAVEAARAAVK
ncbi:MAG: TRAP transporter substrate-binding protein [Oscillospiraceae bacterium]|nr:TRAP transporter substrate-binding protein [Oscillospiraceae bacterium]